MSFRKILPGITYRTRKNSPEKVSPKNSPENTKSEKIQKLLCDKKFYLYKTTEGKSLKSPNCKITYREICHHQKLGKESNLEDNN